MLREHASHRQTAAMNGSGVTHPPEPLKGAEPGDIDPADGFDSILWRP